MLNLDVIYRKLNVNNTHQVKVIFKGSDLYQISRVATVISLIELALYKHIIISKENGHIKTYKLTPKCEVNINNPVMCWSFYFILPDKEMQSLVYDQLYSIVGNSK